MKLFLLANKDIVKTKQNFLNSFLIAIYSLVISIIANLIKPIELVLNIGIIRLNIWQLVCFSGFSVLSVMYGIKLSFFKEPIKVRYLINYTVENIIVIPLSLISYGSVIAYAIHVFRKLFFFKMYLW